MRNDVFVVIPAHNEERIIASTINDVKKYYRNIIVVDDGSDDRTGEVAKKSGAITISHLINTGVGVATTTGVDYAIKKGANVIVTMDADGQHKSEDVKKVVEAVKEEGVDIAIGSRFLTFGKMPFVKKVGNKMLTYVINFLTKSMLTDSQSGLKAFKREAYERLDINAKGYDICSEIILEAKRKKLSLKEVPIARVYTEYSKKKGTTVLVGIRILVRILLNLSKGEEYQPATTRLKEESEKVIKDIMEWTKNDDYYDVIYNIKRGAELLAEEWNEKNPKTPEEIKTFYKETKNYVYDLTGWHFGKRRKSDIRFIQKLLRIEPESVLEFGCGIAQNAIMISKYVKSAKDIVAADLDSRTLDFAEFRVKKHGYPVKIWRIDNEDVPQTKFDVILCLDVLDHLTDEEFKKTIVLLKKLKKKDGKVFISAGFEATETHPMHTQGKDWKIKMIEELAYDRGALSVILTQVFKKISGLNRKTTGLTKKLALKEL